MLFPRLVRHVNSSLIFFISLFVSSIKPFCELKISNLVNENSHAPVQRFSYERRTQLLILYVRIFCKLPLKPPRVKFQWMVFRSLLRLSLQVLVRHAQPHCLLPLAKCRHLHLVKNKIDEKKNWKCLQIIFCVFLSIFFRFCFK